MRGKIICAALMACVATAIGILGAAPVAQPIPKPAPLIPDGGWADALKQHPRILGPKSYLMEMARIKPSEYREMKSEYSQLKYHGGLLPAGVVNAVEGVPKSEADKFVRDAMADVASGVKNKHQGTWIAMEDVARTYDLFYNSISPSDRAKMINWLNAELGAYTIDEGAFHNSTMSKIHCYLEVAYATWGDNPRAREFRDFALTTLYEGRIVPVLKEYGAGGGYTECGWYTRGCLFNLVEGLEMARRFEHYDGFAKCPQFFYDRLAYEMLQPYPAVDKRDNSEWFSCEGDGSSLYSIAEEYPRMTRNILAQYWRGSPLSHFIAARNRNGSNNLTRFWDFIWEEKPDSPADVNTFPLAHAALGIGKVFARGDWTDDSSWLRFECGSPFTQHQHLESGSFEIFRRDKLAVQSGEYNDDWGSPHAVNWLIRTVANNCILIYMPGETFKCSREETKNEMVNDGGQMDNIVYSRDLETWLGHLNTNDHGHIVAYDNEPSFMYVAGDSTKAYNPAKATKVLRQIVFIRPNTFIIYDHVGSVQADYVKSWLLHCINEPRIEGNAFAVTNGSGKLTGQVLLPEKVKIAAVHGYTYHGQTFEAVKGTQNPVAVKWRIEENPAVAAKDDVFLHVLQTEDRPVQAKLIHKAGLVGASGGNWEVLFDNNLGVTITIDGKTTPLRASVKPGEYE